VSAVVLCAVVLGLAGGRGLAARETAGAAADGGAAADPGASAPARFPYAVTLDLTLSPGLLTGQAEEIVYADEHKISQPAWEEDDKFSQLLWDLDPLFYMGMGAEIAPRNSWTRSGFFVKTGIRLGFPGRVGVMEDRDWGDDDDPNQLTHYSHHDASITEAFLWDTRVGFSWAVHPAIRLRFWGEYSYHHFAWSGDDGEGQYARYIVEWQQYYPWDDNPRHETFSGQVITYSQTWYLYWLGLSIDLRPHPRFQMGWSFGVAPPFYLDFGSTQIANWAKCVDDHKTTGGHYTDYVLRGVSFTAVVEFTYALLDGLDLVLTGTYRYSSGYKGLTYQPGEAAATGTGGAGIRYLDAALTVRLGVY